MNNGPKKRDSRWAAAGQTPADTPDAEMEAALRVALQPEEVPAGFADRVVTEALMGKASRSASPADGGRGGRMLHWPLPRLWITGAVAAALIVGLLEGGLAWEHVRQQQRRVREATQQFQATERITVHALAQAREQLQRAGVPLTLD